MIPFAVTIDGLTNDDMPAVWALAVTEQRLLTATEDGRLVWYPLHKCRFVKLVPPDGPKPVVIVKPESANGPIVVPRPLRPPA